MGLELGADDYVVKPFGLRELVARIRAVTRRTSDRAHEAKRLTVGPLVVDDEAHRAELDGRPLELTPKEFGLLVILASQPEVAVRRHRILSEIWDTSWFGSTKTLDVHVASLRRKLGNPAWIETVRGIGFRLHEP